MKFYSDNRFTEVAYKFIYEAEMPKEHNSEGMADRESCLVESCNDLSDLKKRMELDRSIDSLEEPEGYKRRENARGAASTALRLGFTTDEAFIIGKNLTLPLEERNPADEGLINKYFEKLRDLSDTNGDDGDGDGAGDGVSGGGGDSGY